MPALGAKLVEVLAGLEVQRRPIFQMRLAAFKTSLKPELAKIGEIRKSSSGVVVTATEPVFGYMCSALGFKVLNYDFQVAIMNDAEPTASQTAAFEKCLRTRAAKILFYNSQVTDPTTARLQELAKSSGMPVVGVTETQPPDQKTYAE